MKLEENADVMVITDLCPLFADVPKPRRVQCSADSFIKSDAALRSKVNVWPDGAHYQTHSLLARLQVW